MKALDLKFECGDLKRTLTIREYLKELLITLFQEGESFSGKRPFGNSGWEYDVYKPLIEAKLIPGKIDKEDGYIEEVDHDKAQKYIKKLIKAL